MRLALKGKPEALSQVRVTAPGALRDRRSGNLTAPLGVNTCRREYREGSKR